VCAFVGARDPAADLLGVFFRFAHEGEGRYRKITGLLVHDGKVDRATVDAWRSPCLQAVDAEWQLAQPGREAVGWRIAGPPALVVLESDMNATAEKGADGQYDSFRPEFQVHLGNNSRHLFILDDEIGHGLLENIEVWLVLERLPHGRFVEQAVCLCAGCAHGRSLA
jgi:hypothetical protein